MTPNWEYVQLRMEDRLAAAERHRRVAAARSRRGAPRLTSLLRAGRGRSNENPGCRD